MNKRQIEFCREYAKNNDLKKAAKKASYSENYAASLLKNEKIKAEIKRNEKKKLTRKEIVEDIALLKDMCMGKVKVKETVKGEETEFTMFNPSCANKSLEMLEKQLGYFEEEEKECLKIVIDYGSDGRNESGL